MRFRLGPGQLYTPPSLLAATAAVAPSGKPDPDPTVIKEIVADTLTLTIPVQNPEVTTTLTKVRAYLVPEGQEVPSTADAYVASSLSFTEADVTPLVTGGDIVLVLPAATVACHCQVVEGFDE